MGNVWEWTQDCWHDSYANAPNDGAAWEVEKGVNCTRRVVRGGSWIFPQAYLRSAFRTNSYSDTAADSIGFRLARTF
ncbi:hypothetical protein CCP3SC15_2960003 [Gammaproteobacteria bacterium]